MLNKRILFIILGVGVVVVFGGLTIMGKLNVDTSQNVSEESVDAQSDSPETEKTGTNPSQPKPETTQPSQVQQSVSMTSPLAGEKLVIGQNHQISWSKESGFTGFLYLVDATTDETIGFINSETGPRQTSYTWNVTDLYLSRYNAAKKPLAVGKYKVGIGFDSKQSPVSSGIFEIIYASQATVNTYDLKIQNFTISPVSITVKKGSLLKFSNADNFNHKLVLSGRSPFSIPSGQQFTFDTSILFPGLHRFYLEGYPAGEVNVTVQ